MGTALRVQPGVGSARRVLQRGPVAFKTGNLYRGPARAAGEPGNQPGSTTPGIPMLEAWVVLAEGLGPL